MRDAVFSYASATHSTILSGSGEYSNSIEIAASGMSRCLIASQVGRKVDDAPARGQVAVHLAVAIRDVNVSHFSFVAVRSSSAGCRASAGGRCRGWPSPPAGRPRREPRHARHVVQKRKGERLELECDLEAELGGVLAEGLHVLDGGPPLLFAAESLPSARCIRPGPGARFSPRRETPCPDRRAHDRGGTAGRWG